MDFLTLKHNKVPINAFRAQNAQSKKSGILRRSLSFPLLLLLAAAVLFAAILVEPYRSVFAQEGETQVMLPFVTSGNDLEQTVSAAGILKKFTVKENRGEFKFPIGTADPTARVFNGRLYVYTSTDAPLLCHDKPEEDHERRRGGKLSGQGGFCMPGYQIFSTSDMKKWTQHSVGAGKKKNKVILNQSQVRWAHKGSARMWAPDVVKVGQKYYMLFPAPNHNPLKIQGKDGTIAKPGLGPVRGNPSLEHKFHSIGVAVSNNPAGPFKPRPKAIKGIGYAIDPSVVNVNGQHYIFLSGGELRKINNTFTQAGESLSLPSLVSTGDVEGIFAFKRAGKLWLHYAHYGQNVGDGGYVIKQAVAKNSKNPAKGFSDRGVAIKQFSGNTNHGSVVAFKGKSWYFFHKHTPQTNGFNHRQVHFKEVKFDSTGYMTPFGSFSIE